MTTLARTTLLAALTLVATQPAALAAPETPAASSDPVAADQHGPSSGYFSLSALLGAQRAIHLGGAVDLGIRAKDSAVFAHAMIAGGDSGLLAEGGSFMQLRVGAEGRVCGANGSICAFAGADVGYQHDDAVTYEWIIDGELMETDAQDLLLVPRVGTEYGRTIKVRATLEAPLYTRIDGGASETGYSVQGTGGIGFAF